MTDTITPIEIPAPTAPGFYKYVGGRQTMLFLLRSYDKQWFTVFDNGEMHKCEWGYIEQALSVYDLEKIA